MEFKGTNSQLYKYHVQNDAKLTQEFFFRTQFGTIYVNMKNESFLVFYCSCQSGKTSHQCLDFSF